MGRNDNHSRAQKVVDSWPSWKKEVSLTKHSTSSSRTCMNGERTQKESSSQQRVAEIST